MPQDLLIARHQTAGFNSGLSIISRLDEQFRKMILAYVSRDGYAIMDALERLYAELDSELLDDERIYPDLFLTDTERKNLKDDEIGEAENLRAKCNKIMDELSQSNQNREDKQLTRPILMTRELKESLFKFELWVRRKLKERGMMMPSKDIEDVRLVMGKV